MQTVHFLEDNLCTFKNRFSKYSSLLVVFCFSILPLNYICGYKKIINFLLYKLFELYFKRKGNTIKISKEAIKTKDTN